MYKQLDILLIAAAILLSVATSVAFFVEPKELLIPRYSISATGNTGTRCLSTDLMLSSVPQRLLTAFKRWNDRISSKSLKTGFSGTNTEKDDDEIDQITDKHNAGF